MKMHHQYPLAAIVGQQRMKQALILNALYPGIGGVLIRGEKGTAKSTVVRGLAELLPFRTVVKGCPFRCDPEDASRQCDGCVARFKSGEAVETENVPMRVVDLPVGATEDRVVGTLDIAHALVSGKKRFEPGVLAEANGNILYVDEVNLLEDHIVDVLLDAAAMGVNYVEREGISFSHPARFILVGTMNPEEGDLRPQLLDRFGLVVDVAAEREVSDRMEIVRRRLAFEADPEAFVRQWEKEQASIRERIEAARHAVTEVVIPELLLRLAAFIALTLGVDGHRADITMLKAAKALAAFKGIKEVTREELFESALLALPHRMKKRPFEDHSFDRETLEQIVYQQEAI